MQCCGTWNTVCCQTHHPGEGLVSFDNLKKKYFVNEDIRVEYTLHGDVQQTSTRDWLGIFPRGWTNLQQYLTFEYALVAPRAASSPNRTIVFPRVFHREASLETEYQLVYVRREIQVLAVSPYFRFFRDQKIDSDTVLGVPCRERSTCAEKREIYVEQLGSSGWAPPRVVLSDQSLQSLHPLRATSANQRIPTQTCRSCGRQRDKICGLTLAISRARFLKNDDFLPERVVRLERDLVLANRSKYRLAVRLRAYENFVAEMLGALATKRVVKITDTAGKEILIQQILTPSNPEVVTTVGQQNSNVGNVARQKSGDAEADPNTKLEQTAEEETTTRISDRTLTEDKPRSARIDDQSSDRIQGGLPRDDFVIVEDFKDLVLEETRTRVDAETQTIDVDTNCKREPLLRKTSNVEESKSEVSSCDEEERSRVEGSDTLKTSEAELGEEVPEKVSNVTSSRIEEDCTNINNEDNNDETKALLSSKPSAIVIQGSNVKFAIIRY